MKSTTRNANDMDSMVRTSYQSMPRVPIIKIYTNRILNIKQFSTKTLDSRAKPLVSVKRKITPLSSATMAFDAARNSKNVAIKIILIESFALLPLVT